MNLAHPRHFPIGVASYPANPQQVGEAPGIAPDEHPFANLGGLADLGRVCERAARHLHERVVGLVANDLADLAKLARCRDRLGVVIYAMGGGQNPVTGYRGSTTRSVADLEA